ncbi:MAG: hypothetical protein WCP33_03980 [Deltaproteobacteria bacterium]
MEINTAEYRTFLIKCLDMSRESHAYILERVPVLLIDIAKTYLWVASVESGIAMFLIKDGCLSPYSTACLGVSLSLATIVFILSLYILWGRGFVSSPATEPMNLYQFAWDQFTTNPKAETEAYAGLIASLSDANRDNSAKNTTRAQILRISAPLLFLSFGLLVVTVILRLCHA